MVWASPRPAEAVQLKSGTAEISGMSSGPNGKSASLADIGGGCFAAPPALSLVLTWDLPESAAADGLDFATGITSEFVRHAARSPDG